MKEKYSSLYYQQKSAGWNKSILQFNENKILRNTFNRPYTYDENYETVLNF